MIVFKTYLRVVKKCLVPIIIYTSILILFSSINTNNNDTTMSFTAEKPDILIINQDQNSNISNNLVNYITENSNIIDIDNSEEKINDAIFYRDVNYVIYIPENYGINFLENKNPEIEIKSTGDYQASLASLLLERYLKVANTFLKENISEEDLISKINNNLKTNVNIKMTSKLDSTSLSKATNYYNFSNYCLLGGSIYVICLILSSFQSKHIRKRTIISSMDDKKYNTYLLISNSLFAFILWLLYVIISFIVAGSIMFTLHGLLYIINSFIFNLCSLTIAFLIGNLISNKEAINGIVNVIALGSSFLCGSFVPAEFLPDIVLKVSHILPSYWFINSNNLIKTIEVFNFESIKPFLINGSVILLFTIVFAISSIIISSKKRKIG